MTPFSPRHVKDLAGEIPEAPNWLVHGLLPRSTFVLIVAYPKVGKSTLATQLAVGVAQGRDFLGRRTEKGGVLWVAAEELKDDVMRRLRHFGMKSDDPIWLWTETVTDTSDDRERLRQFIRENHIALVLVDTLATYLLLKDETDNSAVTRHLKLYVDMAHSSAGTVILFVHHERKNRGEGDDDAKAIRGGGAILGLADVSFQLQKVESGGTARRLKIVGRYQEIPRSLKLDYRDDEYVSLGTPEENARIEKCRKAVAVLPPTGIGRTVDEVAKETALGKAAARTALEDAYSQRSAIRSGGGRRGDPYRYWRSASVTDETGASLAGLTEKTGSQAEKVEPEGRVDGPEPGSEFDDLLDSTIEASAHA